MEQDFKGPQIETQIEIPKAKKWVELSDYKTDEKNTFWEGLTGGSIWQTLVTGMPGWWNRDKTKIEREEGNGIVSAPSLQHYHQNLDSETQKPTKQVKIPHAYNSYWDSAVFLECVCVCVCARARTLSHFICVPLFVTLWTIVFQAPLSMGFSRQEYWSGLLYPPPGGLLDSGIEPVSPAVPALKVDSLPLSHRRRLFLNKHPSNIVTF